MNKRGADLIFPVVGFILLMLLFAVLIIVTFVPKALHECTFPVEVDCVSYALKNSSSETIVLYVKNNFHENATLQNADVVDSKCSYTLFSSQNGSREWLDGDVLRIGFDCKDIKKSEEHVIINLDVLTASDYTTQRYTGQILYYSP